MSDIDVQRDEYQRCKEAYDRAEPFATEALARNCPFFIAALEGELKDSVAQEKWLGDANLSLQELVKLLKDDLDAMEERALHAERIIFDGRM